MPIRRHGFTQTILDVLSEYTNTNANDVLERSSLIQYLNIKTEAANRGSNARASYGNHYAIYILVEDYLNQNYHISGEYNQYEGARFSDLLRRQRELPFGSKLQNHALNHRLNQEFKKFFPNETVQPVVRDPETNRYWINENLLTITCGDRKVNLAESIKVIIDKYIEVRQKAFHSFIEECQRILKLKDRDAESAESFVVDLLNPNVDARIFEIVSFAILKAHFADKVIYWGWSLDDLNEDILVLYKTGRTNANDGGIDFVMRPLGRFFQVTETVDVGKYFLDIDKIQRYPITFVVKSTDSVNTIIERIRSQAIDQYSVQQVVEKYMKCIEEVVNVPRLISIFNTLVERQKIGDVIEEIVQQSEVEFNFFSEEEFIDSELL
ncbi:MAG: restriction endonuclease [Bacteroidetes bacterium]|nr:restriction endonuclease [Bacteroidota bacterium]